MDLLVFLKPRPSALKLQLGLTHETAICSYGFRILRAVSRQKHQVRAVVLLQCIQVFGD